MKYAIGKKVRVKSFEEIWKTLDEGSHLKGETIFFNDRMKVHCGKVYEIKSFAGPYYELTSCESDPGNYWNWPEEWVEPVIRFKAGDLALVRPDLVPGKMYGNEAFIDDMIPTKGIVVEIKNVDSFMNLYHIKGNHWNYSDEMFLTLEEAFRAGRMVRKKDGSMFSNGKSELMVGDLIGNEVWLPEIQIYVSAQDLVILPDLTQTQIDSKVALSNIPRTLEISDIDYEIKIDTIRSNVIYSNWFNPIKITKDYENQLQREKTRIRGAEVPEGSRICSRKRKAAIVFGHLSNQARTGF